MVPDRGLTASTLDSTSLVWPLELKKKKNDCLRSNRVRSKGRNGALPQNTANRSLCSFRAGCDTTVAAAAVASAARTDMNPTI